MNFLFIIVCRLEKVKEVDMHTKVKDMLEKSQQAIKDLPLILALKAGYDYEKSLDELPDWAKRVIIKMREPPILDFTQDYQGVKADIEIEELKDEEQKAIVDFTKIEL